MNFIRSPDVAIYYENILREFIYASSFLISLMAVLGGEIVALFLHYRRSPDFEIRKYGLLVEFSDMTLFEYDRRKDILEFTNNARHVLTLDELGISHIMGKRARTDLFLQEDRKVIGDMLRSRTGSWEDNIQYVEPRLKSISGEYHWFGRHYKTTTSGTGTVVKVAGRLTDISRQRNREQGLRGQAVQDVFTGIYNKAGGRLIDRMAKEEGQGLSLMLGLNGLKSISDAMGHVAGGAVLTELGRVLEGTCRKNDIVARIGGDKFVMFLSGAFDGQARKRKIREVQESLRTVRISIWDIRGIRASIDATPCPEDGVDYETLYKVADETMYQTKEQSKNRSESGRAGGEDHGRTISWQGEQDMRYGRGSVVLSGGQGCRMGGIDKGGLGSKGKSLCGHTQKQLQAPEVPCHLSWVCYENRGDRGGGLEVIEDTAKGVKGQWIDPMDGIWPCFQSTRSEELFFASCDISLLKREMAIILMERWEPGADAVLWRTGDGRMRPMHDFYAATCMEALGDTIRGRNYRLIEFLDAVRCTMVDTSEVYIPDIWLTDVNSPSMYRNPRELHAPMMAVSDRKNTGRIALSEMLVRELARIGTRSVVIKHDGHEFEANVLRIDSRRVKEAGAYGTVVYPGTKFSVTKEQSSMEAEGFFGFSPEADIVFPEGQKYSDVPKLEVLREEVSNVPACRPETMLAYMWDGGNSRDEDADPIGESRRNRKYPVFTVDQKGYILGIVTGHMGRYSRGDGGDEL